MLRTDPMNAQMHIALIVAMGSPLYRPSLGDSELDIEQEAVKAFPAAQETGPEAGDPQRQGH